MVFFLARTIIHRRKNLLNKNDIKLAGKFLKKGDIVLVGGLRRLSSFVIKGPLTHALLYIGNKRFIHAVCDGVETDSLETIFKEYDTLLILRSKNENQKKISKAIKYSLEKIGTPFDYEFTCDKAKFYCSELILNAFDQAGIKTGLKINHSQIHPKSFINSYFKIIFQSHNLNLVTDLDESGA